MLEEISINGNLLVVNAVALVAAAQEAPALHTIRCVCLVAAATAGAWFSEISGSRQTLADTALLGPLSSMARRAYNVATTPGQDWRRMLHVSPPHTRRLLQVVSWDQPAH